MNWTIEEERGFLFIGLLRRISVNWTWSRILLFFNSGEDCCYLEESACGCVFLALL